ncbi:MAG: hypothetical protein ACI4T4_04440 [Limosilactobacillus sp.]
MNKLSKLTITLVASLGIAGAATVTVNQSPVLPTAQAASTENLDLANWDIASYLDNCQQYEANDKQFRGFTSVKQITYTSKHTIRVDVNNDIFQLSKSRRSLLIDILQNGVISTLMDNDLANFNQAAVQKGCKTTVYLNNQVIGHSAGHNYRQIEWNK